LQINDLITKNYPKYHINNRRYDLKQIFMLHIQTLNMTDKTMTQATHQPPQSPRTAIVTGASTGIGLAITQRFINDGINVVMNARSEKDLHTAHQSLGNPENALILAGDIAHKSLSKKLVALAETNFGSLDILVNNAGVFSAKPFLDTEESDIDHFHAINFKGAYFAAQAAIPALQKSHGGAIINIGTTGIIETPLHAKHGINDVSTLSGLHLLNRIGQPRDVADAVAMLATNNFISGTTLRVDGGHSAGHTFG